MKILVGSQAIKWWFEDFREPGDTDYFSDASISGCDVFWHRDLAGYDWGSIATPDELYTIKVSHSFWELHGTWSKHMYDLSFLKKKGHGHFIPELYNLLYPIWEERYGKKKVNLNAKPEDFFNKSVHRVYDHDSIHHSIAYYDRPLFERVLKDGHEVMVDRAKFDALTYEDKVRLVREEVYATALERQVIPSNYTCSPKGAYAWALRKTITSFWKGDWALWVVLNFDELRTPDIDYVNVHRQNKDRLIKL